MSCKSAMIPLDEIISISPEKTVGEALEVLLENGIRAMPVVSKDGEYMGMFHFHYILKFLLPKPVRAEGGVDNLEFLTGTDDLVPERLMELSDRGVVDLMDLDRPILYPNEVFWAAIHMAYKHDAPMAVLESENSKKLVGIVTKQSMIQDMQRRLLERKAEVE